MTPYWRENRNSSLGKCWLESLTCSARPACGKSFRNKPDVQNRVNSKGWKPPAFPFADSNHLKSTCTPEFLLWTRYQGLWAWSIDRNPLPFPECFEPKQNCNNTGVEPTRKHGRSPLVLISVQLLLPHYPAKENKKSIKVKSKEKSPSGRSAFGFSRKH